MNPNTLIKCIRIFSIFIRAQRIKSQILYHELQIDHNLNHI